MSSVDRSGPDLSAENPDHLTDSHASVPLDPAAEAAARRRAKSRKKNERRFRSRQAKAVALEIFSQRTAQLQAENTQLEARSRRAEGVLEVNKRLLTASELRAHHAESRAAYLKRTSAAKLARTEKKVQDLSRALEEKTAEAAAAKSHLADKFRESRAGSTARAAEFVNDPRNCPDISSGHGFAPGFPETSP